jgi:pyridinium-3,5-biscarboxylic acid mononucleotide sulfurtransferase
VEDKYKKLVALLGEMDGALVAFSGGVDSSLLLCAAVEALGDRTVAVTAISSASPPGEENQAGAVARHLGARHIKVQTGEVEDPHYRENSPDRCYYCKGILFGKLKELAAEEGLAGVVEGSNMDDLGDHRPGRKALAEQGVRSPLVEVGLAKSEIRALAKARKLPVWDAPSAACLASRVPYGEEITPERLLRIGKAEAFLRALGFRQLRVRDHGQVARLEMEPKELGRFADEKLREVVVHELTGLGFNYVALDLAGYRTGALNEVL